MEKQSTMEKVLRRFNAQRTGKIDSDKKYL